VRDIFLALDKCLGSGKGARGGGHALGGGGGVLHSEVGHLLEEADAVCNRLTEGNTRAKKRLKELVQVSM
jgi:hypothetical protein